MKRVSNLVLLTLLSTACMPSPGDDVDIDDVSDLPWSQPAYFPRPRIPTDNPPTLEKLTLGRALFHDVRLSANETQSCASCHLVERAFSDGKPLPTGSTGDLVPRNSMGLANVAWATSLTWANPLLTTLEGQALVPLFADHPDPVELGIATAVDDVEARLASDADMSAAFVAAFGDGDDAVTIEHAVQAIATYERSLVSGDSRYDRYFNGGDSEALTDLEKQGLQLFFSERAECYHCHGGAFFTSAVVTADSVVTERGFENNGLYDVDDTALPAEHLGLFNVTAVDKDRGRFKVPGLRNVAVTGPYMHDGSVASLEAVVAHYVKGGALSARQNPLVKALDLTAAEQTALVAFLRALTDDAFITP